MSSAILFDNPSEMEPLFPAGNKKELGAVAHTVWRGSAVLREMLPEHSRKAVADIVRSMNGYYSNLIEGHKTRPADIEAALARSFSKAPKERDRQMLHAAHLDTLSLAEETLTDDTRITSPEYLCWLHKEFFKRLPDEMRIVKNAEGKEYRIEPGTIRESNVSVGAHLAPDSRSLGKMLSYYDQRYATHLSDSPESLIAACAAHHRLVWIHPFDDGNGRIARMATHLWFKKAGAGGAGLWTLSRGLARNLEEYRSRLSLADAKRLHDYDGRGRMSDRRLNEFCSFMLQTANDQVEFMRAMLKIETLAPRLTAAIRQQESMGALPRGSSDLVYAVICQGQLMRTQAASIMGVSPRTAQSTMGILVAGGYLKSPTERGKLSIGFPSEICAFAFPDLFPAGSPRESKAESISPARTTPPRTAHKEPSPCPKWTEFVKEAIETFRRDLPSGTEEAVAALRKKMSVCAKAADEAKANLPAKSVSIKH